MWDRIRPYIRSIFATIVAITVGVAAGSFLPPNQAYTQAAYSSGLSDAQEAFSSQLEAERQQAEQSLSSALQRQEALFSSTLSEAVSEASSEAFQKGKQAVAPLIPSSSSDMGEDSYTEPYSGADIEPYSQQCEELVWIPRSGKRYHSNPGCSGMKDPQEVPLSEAEAQGYTPCQKCYG